MPFRRASSASASWPGGRLALRRQAWSVVNAASTACSSAAACSALRIVCPAPAGARRCVATSSPAADEDPQRPARRRGRGPSRCVPACRAGRCSGCPRRRPAPSARPCARPRSAPGRRPPATPAAARRRRARRPCPPGARRWSATSTLQRSSERCASAIVVTGALRHHDRVRYLIAASTTPLRCARRGGQTAISTP